MSKGPQNSNITSSDNPLIQKKGPWAQGNNQRLEVGGYQQGGRPGAVDKNSMPFGGGKKAGNSGAVAGRGQESSTYQSPQARAGQSGGGGGGGKTSNIESSDNPMLANRGKGGWGGLYEPKQVDTRVNQQVISGQVVDGQQQYQQRQYQGQQVQYAQQQPINQEQVYQQLDGANKQEFQDPNDLEQINQEYDQQQKQRDLLYQQQQQYERSLQNPNLNQQQLYEQNLLKYEQNKQYDDNQEKYEGEEFYQQEQQAGEAVNTTAQMFKGYVQQGRGQQQQKYQQFPVGDEIFNPNVRAAGASSTEMEHIEQIQNRARPLGRGAGGVGAGRGDSKTSNVTSADSPFADYKAGGILDRNQQSVGGQSYQQQQQQEYNQRSPIPQLREQRAAGATSSEMEHIEQIQNRARPLGRGAAGAGAGRGDSKTSNVTSDDSPFADYKAGGIHDRNAQPFGGSNRGGAQQQQGRGGQASRGRGDPKYSNQTSADSPFASGGGW